MVRAERNSRRTSRSAGRGAASHRAGIEEGALWVRPKRLTGDFQTGSLSGQVADDVAGRRRQRYLVAEILVGLVSSGNSQRVERSRRSETVYLVWRDRTGDNRRRSATTEPGPREAAAEGDMPSAWGAFGAESRQP